MDSVGQRKPIIPMILFQDLDDKENRFFKESAMESTLELPEIFFLSDFLDLVDAPPPPTAEGIGEGGQSFTLTATSGSVTSCCDCF